jgi:transcriptional regulator with XRE-family HTH domain
MSQQTISSVPLTAPAAYYSHLTLVQSPVSQTLPAVSLQPHGIPVEWSDSEYRNAYVIAAIEQGVAWQIRLNREARGLSQAQLAELVGTKQSAISRLEDPTYGKYSIDTLLKIATAFDCALSLRFVPFSKVAIEAADLSPEALVVASFDQEMSGEIKHG